MGKITWNRCATGPLAGCETCGNGPLQKDDVHCRACTKVSECWVVSFPHEFTGAEMCNRCYWRPTKEKNNGNRRADRKR